MMTFISSEQVWIDAYFTENNLGNIAIGDRAEVVLDAHPGQVFNGKVVSLNSGASSSPFSFSTNSARSTLPTTPRMSGWMRDPQRFPVRIVLQGHEQQRVNDNVQFRFNGQADIVVYTHSSNEWFNALAQVWMRFISYLSYAY